MNESNAKLYGLMDIWNSNGLIFEEDLSGIRLINTAENFHQGGLASAVFAYQSDHLPSPNLQIHLVQGDNARKALRDAAH